MPDNYSSDYQAGGLDYGDNGAPVGTLGGIFGRLRNNWNGTTAQNIFNMQEAEKARVFSSAEAAKNRDWQEMMSNTAYQRAVADMQAAGLNPAAIGADGASTPAGAVATPTAATAANNYKQGGGILSIIGTVARLALSKALFAKFAGSALSAAQHGETVSKSLANVAAKEATSAGKLNRALESQKLMNEEALRIRKAHDAKFGF